MKKIIIIGAALLVTTGAVLVAGNVCSTGDCPVCPQGTCCPTATGSEDGQCCTK
jgi:hypothetical protein